MDILSKFAENLNFLMNDKNLTQLELAQKTKLKPASVCKYLKGNCMPTLNALLVLADFFNCSTDYLLGLIDDGSEKRFLPCPPFAERIMQVLKLNGYNPYEFCKAAKLNDNRFYDWKNGKHQPSVESVIKIAKFFDYSLDYLLGREN